MDKNLIYTLLVYSYIVPGTLWAVFAFTQQMKRDTACFQAVLCVLINLLFWFICIPVAWWKYGRKSKKC